MLTKEEYKKEYVRMMDSLRDRSKGMPNCNDVKCTVCPLSEKACIPFGDTDRRFLADDRFLVFEAIEIVEEWSKAHPIVTRADKFKEVFGVEPKNVGDRYECPWDCGFKEKTKCNLRDRGFGTCCKECARAFWEAEYVAPDADRSERHDQ